MVNLKYIIIPSLVALFGFSSAFALTPYPYHLALKGEGSTLAGETLSLGINGIATYGDHIWIATSNGLGHSPDGGETWQAYFAYHGLGDDVLPCVDAVGDTWWVGCIDEESEGIQYIGAGVSITTDGGRTWRTIGNDEGLPVEGLFKVPWDILLASDYTWVATWTDGVGRSADGGDSWTMFIPENDLGEKIYYTYAFAEADDYLWVGTEMGIARTPDAGLTWQVFDRSDGLLGLFYPTIHLQAPGVLWGGTGYELVGEHTIASHGAVLTQDNGETWTTFLAGLSGLSSNVIYDITSVGEWAFLATPEGINYTNIFQVTITFEQITTANGLPSNEVYSLAADDNGVLWAGTGNGLAKSEDLGESWTIIDYRPETGELDVPQTYAYPSPFSPRVDGACTIVYSLFYPHNVSILIYDFAGELVKTVVDGELRGPGDNLEEKWYGINDRGEDVANGVYFYVIKVDGEVSAYGKVAVLQ